MPKPPPMPPTVIGPGPFGWRDVLIVLLIVTGGLLLAGGLYWGAR